MYRFPSNDVMPRNPAGPSAITSPLGRCVMRIARVIGSPRRRVAKLVQSLSQSGLCVWPWRPFLFATREFRARFEPTWNQALAAAAAQRITDEDKFFISG